jgi:hypothetical protein
LCGNGSIIRLYDDRNRLCTIWTSQATGQKLLAEIPGGKVHLTSDERLALVAPILLPGVASLVKPLAKGVVKGGLTLADKAREFAGEAGEQVSDLVAEAQAEHYSKAP